MTDTLVTKLIYIPTRNPKLSKEEFPERWRQHSMLGATVPVLRPHFQQVAQCLNNHDRTVIPDANLSYDGINILTMTYPGAAADVFQHDAVHQVMFPDELETFSTYVRHFSLFADEEVVNEGKMRASCLVSCLKRKPEIDAERFKAGLSQALTELTGDTNRRCVINHVTDRQPDYNYDAVIELWFDGDADLSSFATTEAYANTFLNKRRELCDEFRSLNMWTSINYARPAIG